MSIKNAKTDTEGAWWGIPFRVRGADGTSINIKGSKDNVSQLPTVGNSEGDAYLIGGTSIFGMARTGKMLELSREKMERVAIFTRSIPMMAAKRLLLGTVKHPEDGWACTWI